MTDKLIKIELNHYHHTCGDGCCDTYGTIVKVNGQQLPYHNTDTATIVRQVLQHLGYKVQLFEDGNEIL